jgi:hypothetical protein
MNSGQFVKGMINGTEEAYESRDILQILPMTKLSILWDLDRVGTYRRVFLDERVIAQTVITIAEQDEHGRDGIVNHTVLHKFDASTTHDGIKYVFDSEQFARDAKTGKYNFKMPPCPELKTPLDEPSPMEIT